LLPTLLPADDFFLPSPAQPTIRPLFFSSGFWIFSTVFRKAGPPRWNHFFLHLNFGLLCAGKKGGSLLFSFFHCFLRFFLRSFNGYSPLVCVTYFFRHLSMAPFFLSWLEPCSFRSKNICVLDLRPLFYLKKGFFLLPRTRVFPHTV